MSWILNVFKSKPDASDRGDQDAPTAFRRSHAVQRQPGEGRIIAATSFPIRRPKRPLDGGAAVAETRKRPKLVGDQSTNDPPNDREALKPSRKRQRSPVDDEGSKSIKRVRQDPAFDDDVAGDNADSLGEENVDTESATIGCGQQVYSTIEGGDSSSGERQTSIEEVGETGPEDRFAGDGALATLNENEPSDATEEATTSKSLEKRIKKVKLCLEHTAHRQAATVVNLDLNLSNFDFLSAEVVGIGQWPGSHLVPGQKNIDTTEPNTIELPKGRSRSLHNNEPIEISIRMPKDRSVIKQVRIPELFEPQKSVVRRSKKSTPLQLVAKVPQGHAMQTKLKGSWNKSVGRPTGYLRR